MYELQWDIVMTLKDNSPWISMAQKDASIFIGLAIDLRSWTRSDNINLYTNCSSQMEVCPHGIVSTNSIVTSMCIGSQRMFPRNASRAGCPDVGHLFGLDFTHSSRIYSFQTWFRSTFLYCRYLWERSSNYSGELDQGILSLYFKFWQGGWWQTSDNYRQKYGFVGESNCPVPKRPESLFWLCDNQMRDLGQVTFP